jgi:hypothetical protein
MEAFMRSIILAAVLSLCLSGLSHATPINILGGSGSVHNEGFSVRFSFSGIDNAGNVYQGSAADQGFSLSSLEALPGETFTYHYGLLNPGPFSVNGVPFNAVDTGWQVSYTGSVTLPSVFVPGLLTVGGPTTFGGSVLACRAGNCSSFEFSAPGFAAIQFFGDPGIVRPFYTFSRLDAAFGGQQTTLAPEPSTWLLLASGMAVIVGMRGWTRKTRGTL